MTVEAVLKRKRNVVFTTLSDTPIGDVVGNFGRNEAGSLLVIDQSDLVVGLLTERAILTALGDQGPAALSLPVSAVMAMVRFRCRPQDTLARAQELMTRGATQYLPVVENGRLVGIISLTDMMAAKFNDERDDNEWMREYICSDYSISYERNCLSGADHQISAPGAP